MTLKIISQYAVRHLERHFVCVLRIEWRPIHGFRHLFRKTHTKWRSRWLIVRIAKWS